MMIIIINMAQRRHCYACGHEWLSRLEDDGTGWQPAECPRCKSRKWNLSSRKQIEAHNAVGCALRAGRLVKGPCIECGTTIRVEGHHEDYDKPLDVIWMCRKCHQRMHSQKRGGVSPRIENDRLLADGGSQGKSERLGGVVGEDQEGVPRPAPGLPVDRELVVEKDEYSQE